MFRRVIIIRYLLQNELSFELSGRLEYLIKATKLWFIPHYSLLPDNNFIELTSITPNTFNILFIVGHNNTVKQYLNTNKIPESIIVIITCNSKINIKNIKFSRNTRVYLTKQLSNKYALTLDGDRYGFKFDPTISEISFYNDITTDSIEDRINNNFDLIINNK